MKLIREDADLFFKLMWGLQFFVNQQLRIWPDVQSIKEYAALPMPGKAKVRDALWQNSKLINAYLELNPDHLSVLEQKIVCKWQRFIADTFHIFRFLKKNTIFIGKQSQVYAVLGIQDNPADVFDARPLPIMVEAVLLPFKGQIVYDGLLKIYNVSFGSGIRSDLQEKYMVAKQNARIITTLEPEADVKARVESPGKSSQEWLAIVEEIAKASERMRGGPVVQGAALTLLRASSKVAEAALKRKDGEDLWQLTRLAQNALRRLQTVLQRVK